MTHSERVEIALDIYQRRWHRLAKFTAEGMPEMVIARECRLAAKAADHLCEVAHADDPPPVLLGQGTSQTRWPKENPNDQQRQD